MESIRTLLRITRMTHIKSCLIIIYPNSHAKLTTSEIRSSWTRFWTLLRITFLVHRKSYMVIICHNSQEKLTNSELVKVGIGSNIAQNHSSAPCEVISDHYLPQFTCKVDQKWIRSSWSRFEHCSESLF